MGRKKRRFETKFLTFLKNPVESPLLPSPITTKERVIPHPPAGG
jgi:hypothetical protein